MDRGTRLYEGHNTLILRKNRNADGTPATPAVQVIERMFRADRRAGVTKKMPFH